MARKSKNTIVFENGGKGDWRDRVHHISLTRNDENEAAEWWNLQTKDWGTLFEELLDSYWAIKISPPARTDDYWVSLSRRRDGDQWDGHTFIVRYPGFEGAIVLAYYVVQTFISEGRIQTDSRTFLDKETK